MSTDTAFALGMLALVGSWLPDRVRTYLLTFSVVDDLAGLAVIAIVYSANLKLPALFMGVGILVAVAVVRAAGVRFGPVYFLLGAVAWVAFFKSGVDPVVVGLFMGLLTYARPAARSDLERASDLFRLFREQPTPELAREARDGVRLAISPNERLQQLYHPWSSYLIVPLFALANAGIVINTGLLSRAYTSPVTLGILIGYVVGKPVGTTAAAWLVTKLSRGRIRPPVGWAGVVGAGTIAGIGFTVALLIASLAFHGPLLAEAKLGILSAAFCASAITWTVFRVTRLLPKRLKVRALLGTSTLITDLAVPVDPDRDHIRGPERGAGHHGGVRRLRVPVLRPGRADRPGTAVRLRRRPVRVPAPAAERRAPARPAGRGRRRGRRPAGQVLGDARHADGASGRAHRART